MLFLVTFLVNMFKIKFDLDCTIQKRSKPKSNLKYEYVEKYNIYFLVFICSCKILVIS